MGLSSWIQKLLARTPSAKAARSSRDDFVHLYLNRLEDRRVLNADVSLVGGNTLVLDNFTGGETLTVRENGANYEFELASGGNWDTTNNGGIGSAVNEIYSVSKTELSGISNGLQIVDPAGNDLPITFENTNFSALVGSLNIDGAGTVSQSGILTITTANLDIDANSINLNDADNDFGTVIINSATDATLNESNGFTLNSATTQGDLNISLSSGDLMLAGDLNTDGTTVTGDEPAVNAGLVSITGNVILTNDVTIDTDAGTTDGSVSISGTVNSDGTARDLTIESGDGNASIAGDIGTGAGGALDILSINNDDRNGTFTSDGQRGTGNGTGTISLQNIGSAGAIGANEVYIGNKAETIALNFNGTQYETTGSQFYFANDTFLQQNADLNIITGINNGNRIILHGNLVGDPLATGSSESDIVLTTDTVRLFGFGTITGIRSLDVDTNSSATITSDITTSDFNPTGNENFVRIASSVAMSGVAINTAAGNGNILLEGANVQANGTDLTLNAGTGMISANQLGVNNNEVNVLDITAGTFNLSSGIRTRFQGANAGNVTITVSNVLTLTGDVTINTTVDNGGTTDGTLTVNGAIDGVGRSLTIDVGSNALTLTNPLHDFGTLGVTANSASIADANSLILSNVVVSTAFSLDLASGQSTQAAGTTISGAMSLTTAGAGTLVLSEANTYTGDTILNAGTLLVNNTSGSGTGTGNVAVNTGATLGGTGTVSGMVTVNGGGTLSPGTSPGIIATGNLNLADNSIYIVELEDNNNSGTVAGTDYDQTQVTGTVTIGNNVTLSIQDLGSTEINPGDGYVIIDNDGNDAVVGTFAGLAQGATLTIGGLTGRINYRGGDGNDVVLEVEGPFNFANTGGGDVTVRQNTTNNTIEIVKGGVVVDSRLLTSVNNPTAGMPDIIITGDTTQSDTLTVDYGSGGFFTQLITFNGGEDPGNGDNDRLIVSGGTFDRAEHTFTGSESGDIVYDVDGNLVTTSDQGTISYTGLEPVDMTGSTINNLVFNLPGTADMAILEDDAGAVAGISQIRSQAGTFETTTFANPLVSLTINLGNDDAAFTVADTPDLQTTLNINGQVGANDVVTFTGSLDLGAVGSLSIDVDAITMNDGTSVQTNAGTISLTTTGNVALSRLVTNNTTVTINAGGAITDNTAAEGIGNENIVANSVILNAGTGIGSGAGMLDEAEDIDINGGNLSATNTVSGEIQIFESDSIALNTVSNTAVDADPIVVIDAGAAITDANIALEGAGNENIVANTTRLRAVSGIGTSGTLAFGDGEDIDISGGTLFAENTGVGSIQVFSVADLALGQIIDNAVAGQTVLIESAGNITDFSTDETLANVSTTNAGLKAATGIGVGANGDIDTTVDLLTAITVTGDITLEDTNALEIGDVGNNVPTGVQITSAVSTDNISVTANGTLTVTEPVIHAGTGNISLTAVGADLNINGNVTTNFPGRITLTADQNVTLNNAGGTSPTVEVLGAGASVFNSTTARNGIVDATGIITIDAGDTTSLLGNNSVIRSIGRVIQITTDDLVIQGTSQITTGATDPNGNNGAVMIRNATAGLTIQLGGAGTELNIDNAELQRITTNSLRIGRLDGVQNAGNIQFEGNFTAVPASITTVQLFTGGSVSQNVGAVFSADEISIFAGIAGQMGVVTDGIVDLDGANNNAIRRLAISAGGSIQFLDNDNDLNIDRVDDLIDNAMNGVPTNVGEGGNNGVMSVNGFVDLRAMAGNLNVRDTGVDPDISAGDTNAANNLAINLIANPVDAFITIDANANVSSTVGAHRYTADNMAINGSITATGQLVHLRNTTDGIAIDLGSTTDANAGTLELSDDELDRITTSLLAIGRNSNAVTSGNITVTATVDTANTTVLHLITAGSVLDDTNGQLIEENLAIESVGSVELDNINSHDVDILAANITGAGSSLTFRDTDGFSVEEVARLMVMGANDFATLVPANDPPSLKGINTNGGNPTGGNVTLIAETGDVVVDQTIDSAADDGGRNSGFIDISTLGIGTIDINATLNSAGTTNGGDGQGGDITLTTANGDITIDATLNALGGNSAVDGGTITLTANDARVNPADQADVHINSPLTTNDILDGTVRGSIAINAADAVFINANISTDTTVAQTGLGTVVISANTDGVPGNDSGNIAMATGTGITAQNGMVTLMTTAGDVGNIVVEDITTNDGPISIDANGINADVLLQATIATTNGDVTINADDTVNFETAVATIRSDGTSNVIVRANADNLDSTDDPSADNNDEIDMTDGSSIDLSLGTGTIFLSTEGTGGGNITLGRLVTQNTTNAAVTVRSQLAVVDGGDMGGADIEADADANSGINIVAVTGVGTEANPLDTMGRRFDVNNTGSGPTVTPADTFDVAIQNTIAAGVDVVIVRLAGASQRTVASTSGMGASRVQFQNNGGGTGELQITAMGVSSGNETNGVDGGLIKLINEGRIVVSASLSSGTGSGGTLIVNGGATFQLGAGNLIQLGLGDIQLNSGPGNGADDILITNDLTINGGSAEFYAPRDIIVGARLLTQVTNGTIFVDATLVSTNGNPINGDILLSADNPTGNMRMGSIGGPILTFPVGDPNGPDGDGGVLVRGIGQVVASGNLLIEGSDLSSNGDGMLVDALPGTIRNGVHIERDPNMAEQVQVVAAGSTVTTNVQSLILQNRPTNIPNNPLSDVILGGMIGTRNPNNNTNRTILIDANDNIHLANDVTIFTPAGVTSANPQMPMVAFGNEDPTIDRNSMNGDGDPVIDDGVAGTTSNLTINSSGTVVFFGRVGDAPSDPDGLPGFTPTPITERIDTLTTDASGQTQIRGGFVSTVGKQFYGDDVFLHADTDLVNSTSFTTTNDAMNAQPGNVTFSGVVRGLDLDPGLNTLIRDDVTLNVAGTTTFVGLVGADPLDAAFDDTQRIGDGTGDPAGNNLGHAITINSSGETVFNNAVFTESGIRQIDGAGRVTFNATVFIDAGTGNRVDGVDDNIDSLFLSDVTLNTVTIFSNGNLTFGSGTVNTDELFIAGGSKLGTTGRDFTDPNRLALEAGTAGVPSRNITINSLVTDPVQMAMIPNEDLTLNLNTGDLLINGSVGNQATNNRFGNLVVQSVDDFLFGPSRTQILLSESLIQLTGINDGTMDDRAVTRLSSEVDVSEMEGIRIATEDVIYDSEMRTNGQRALTQADGTITYTSVSSLTTAGGMVVSDAMAGEIIMQELGGFTATIDAGGGPVVLRALNNLRVSQIRTIGGFVGLTSQDGEVIDQGDQTGLAGAIGTHDIQAAQLRIDAESGIGTTPNLILETLIANFEAINGTNGIAVANTGDLTIGGVQSLTVATLRKGLDQSTVLTIIDLTPLNGVSSVTGNIDLVTTGSMTVTEDIQNQGQGDPSLGNINLTAAMGNFTVNQTTEPADVNMPNVTNIQADNGSVTVNAAVNITMNGTTRTSAFNGNAVLTAGNNFTANNATNITSTNGTVAITTTAGNVLVNDATNISANDGNAVLTAGNNFTANNATNITSTNGMVAINAAAGNVLVNDTTNISATNGKVDIDARMNFSTQTNTMIRGISGNVEVNAGGNGDFRGFVESTDGNNIQVDVDGDFILRDGFMPFDMQVGSRPNGTGGFIDGQIIVVADGRIDFSRDTNAVVRSRTGVIRAVDRTDIPLLRNIITPQINVVGEAVLTFTVGLLPEGGLPGEEGFFAIVDWGDGTTDVRLVNAGEQTIRHTYTEPPNPSNPGADIQIILAIATDPNIHFFGTNNALLPPNLAPLNDAPTLANPSPPPPFGIGNLLEPEEPLLTVSQFINRALNPRNPFVDGGFLPIPTDNLDVVTAFPFFPVPVSGFGSFAIEIEEEPPPFFIPGAGAEALAENIDSGEEESDDLDFSGSEAEEQAEEEIVVKLRVLSPSGQLLYEYVIPQIYLSDPQPLWQKLPNGRYQIVIEEKGRSIPVVVRDVELKDHQVIRRFDRTRQNQNGDSSQKPNGDADMTMGLLNDSQQGVAENPLLSGVAESPASGDASPDQIWENWKRLPAAKQRLAAPPEQPISEKTQTPAAVAGIAGGLALGAMSLRSREQADSQMVQFTKRVLSPAARLRRRLRK